jgi:hypothetical protein
MNNTNATSFNPAANVLPASTLALGLAALMAATRFHDVGSMLHLVDASLAVFFLGGLYLRRGWLFAVFFVEAVVIDLVATTLAGTSDYCMTAAYPFLLPAYAAMWFPAAFFARRQAAGWQSGVILAGLLLASTLVAYAISDGSFYLFSGYFPSMSWEQYLASAVKYVPRYLSSTFAYVAVIVGCSQLLALAGDRRASA